MDGSSQPEPQHGGKPLTPSLTREEVITMPCGAVVVIRFRNVRGRIHPVVITPAGSRSRSRKVTGDASPKDIARLRELIPGEVGNPNFAKNAAQIGSKGSKGKARKLTPPPAVE